MRNHKPDPIIANALKLVGLILLLIGMPLLGLLLHGLDPSPYLEFPPRTGFVTHAPFSRWAFSGISLFLGLVLFPFIYQAVRLRKKQCPVPKTFHHFPWWGWCGLFLLIVSWVTAWTRFPWLTALQPHTFTPLWVSYTLIVNALAYQRKGRCLLVDHPLSFLLLFVASAAFWWFFEFLNRFVQNWYYVGVEFGPWEYFIYATLPFSTVLPAVTSTRELIFTFDWPEKRFNPFLSCRFPKPKILSLLTLFLSSASLFYLGIHPDYLFPLVWIAPLLIFLSLQELCNERHILIRLKHGDWSQILASALAALICGFFWEMWNVYSLAKWKYTIPFVDCCHLFEMPLLGYAGYLPFGLECAVIAGLVFGSRREDTARPV
jgi:hypothetical protein